MYQGLMELDEYRNLFDKFDLYSEQSIKVSPWYWLLPPLKLYLEKYRALKILKKFVDNKQEYRTLMSFSDKATAWYFVSVGGWFKTLSSIYEVLENNHVPYFGWSFIILALIATVSGFFSATYRLSQRRQHKILKKFQQY